jgi:membrane protease YdiL (CAAX protease family)
VTPIANTTLIMRDILRDKATVGQFVLAAVSSLVYSGLLLSVAARLFSNEQLVNPAWEPLSMKGLGTRGSARRRPRLPAIDEAIALFAVSLLLIFYVQPSLTRFGLLPMLTITQLALVLAPAVVFAAIGHWHWRATFRLNPTRAGALVGGALLGLGLVPVVSLLSALQRKVWPANPETEKLISDLFVPTLRDHPFLTPVLVGALAGICEELLFRGPVQTALMRKLKPWTAIVVTAVIFAAAHMDLHGLPLRAVLGLVLGWVVWRTGSIFPGMLVHGLYDAGAVAIASWQVHQAGSAAAAASVEAPVFDAWTGVRLAVGVVLALVGWWMLRRLAAPPAEELPRGFELVGRAPARL